MLIGRLRSKGSVLAAIVFAAGFGCLITGLYTRAPKSYAEVKRQFHPSDRWIVDRKGEPMESYRSVNSGRTLDWVALDEVSPSFQRLLIQGEDKRFFSHPGVDPLAVAGGAWSYLKSGQHRGASTITMQLTGLIKASHHAKRDWREKIAQALAALELERTWTKPEILEAYVNLVGFRGELSGLRAASLGFFAKSPRALDDSESALLVALIRSPNGSPTAVAHRACRLLERVQCADVEQLARRSLTTPYRLARLRDRVPVLSNAFLDSKLASTDGVVRTTLDARIQDVALTAVREQLQELRDKNVGDAAVVVLDTKTGAVLAYAGNAGAGYTTAAQIDGAQMHRQAGSTLKPFVYGTAFEMHLLDLNSLVNDSPEDIGVGGGSVYSPQNYDHTFEGLVSAAEALASSLNVPAVRTLELVREPRVIEKLRALGFSHLLSEEHYGPSLALGTVDISLFELTEAYRRLSLYSDSKVFSDETKEKIFASLSRPEYRRFTFGLESLLGLPFPAAVKTGTSKDMRDNWCIGFTSEFTVGVWVGNFDGQPMWNVSGMTGAAPIWQRLMIQLHPSPPKDQVYAYVPPAKPLAKTTLSQIRYPQGDMLVGLDPDIPKKLQKLPIKIEHPQIGHEVFVDGHKLGESRELAFWPLVKGHHHVELRTASGVVVDDVKFLVR